MDELLTVEEMYMADRLSIAGGIAGIELMENAGRRVCDEIFARWPGAGLVLVLCGPGNNGGDGFVIARVLKERGYEVRLALLGPVSKLRGDARDMAARWNGDTLDPETCSFEGVDLIVDAIFGAGLARNIDGKAGQIVHEINSSAAAVVAVDLPSGISGETGQVLGVAVEADLTVTFFRKKPGHLLVPGGDFCGEVIAVDIGIPEPVLERICPKIFENGPKVWAHSFPEVARSTHKYKRGHTVVLSGGVSSTGAARLAARAALRVGAGVVTIACPGDALLVVAGHETSVMVRKIADSEDFENLLTDARITSVLLGPGNGVGDTTRARVLAALSSKAGLVLDADALTSFEEQPEELFEAIENRDANSVVLTPHEGEFSRLFKRVGAESLEIDSKDCVPRLERARMAARMSRAVVVLKGPDTIIAAPDGRAVINANAPPWLASAGSGDVLSGLASGLLGQGMTAFESAAASVWIHGAAGAVFGRGLIAEDLPNIVPEILQKLQAMD